MGVPSGSSTTISGDRVGDLAQLLFVLLQFGERLPERSLGAFSLSRNASHLARVFLHHLDLYFDESTECPALSNSICSKTELATFQCTGLLDDHVFDTVAESFNTSPRFCPIL
jgi:hypothetical protein